ncbi:unnamed protein product [Auanema sp. JU1783]|nr:unnamed protein product [Auanema sp. JU1783]
MRASRRHTSKTVLDDGPSTSSDSKIKDVDEQKIELVARLLRQIRAVRDRREAQVRRSLRRENSAWTEEKINQYISAKLMGMNSHVEELEKRTTGILLEDILANSKYTNERVWHPTVQPVKSVRALSRVCSPVKALAPIEIKVEENNSLGSVTESHSLLSVNTGETNVEKAAKQEAQVMARIAELRRAGLWTQSRLPLCVEPSRNKTHWDYLLEEVKWMANDFRQERLFKRNMARKIASAIHKQKKEQEMEVERAEQRRIKEGKRICATIAKMVRDFWQNVDKVVDFRAQEILESKKRKALDQHLAFIVGEADKLSSLVQEGLVQEKTSKSPSIASKDDYDDAEFHLKHDDESDDESTIAKEEQALRNHDVAGEINDLNREADQDMEDLIASLPPDYLASLGVNIPRPESTLSVGESVNTEPDTASTSDAEEQSSIIDSSRKSDEIKEEDGPTSPKRRRVEEQSEDSKSEKDVEEGNGDGRGMLENVDYAKLHSVNSDERQQELANIAEEALKFQPKGFTLETTQVKTVVPFLIRGNLREYQMVGLDWLVTLYEKNLNGILADEMGLGKTIQTISLLAHLACTESNWGPHLIVVPTSVILNWEMEIKKWCPALKILTYFGSVNDRKEKRKGWSKQNSFHVCITSYKTITTDIRSFKMKAWQYLILDEAQNIKNWKSQRWQALLNIRARRRLLLTGTPLQNSLMELWSLMHFLMPAIFASHDDFKDWFSNPLTGMMEGSVEYNAPLVQRLHKVLRPFILRRLKSEVEKQLPEKTEHVIKCQLSKRQRYLYDDFMSRRSTKDNLKSGNMMSVLNIVMQLRKCCNHPNLFEPRPVISPFALSSIQTNFPAIIFDICGENSRDDKEIPKCFLLNERFQGYNTSVKSKKPTIEELNSFDEPSSLPKVDGFSIQRPPLERRERLSDDALKAAALSLGSENIKKLGLSDGETFIVVRDNEEAVRVQARPEGMNGMVKMKIMDGKVLAEGGPVGVGTRMYKLLNINGETSLHDLGIVSSSTVDTISEGRDLHGAVKLKPVVHPSLRTNTVLSGAPNGSKDVEQSGFHHLMAEGGVRENIVNYAYQFSPPLKRRKLSDSPLISGDYKECVPSLVCDTLAREKLARLEKAQSRFGLISKPIFSHELLKVLSTECKEVVRKKRDHWYWDGWNAHNDDIEEVLNNYTDFIINKFVLYVAPALSDSPSVKAISSGRTPSAILCEKNITSISRTILQDARTNLHRVMLSNSLQFPELRLIEYDCGKLQILANLLRDLYLYKHRCLIFTQMSKMLDVLQAFLSYHGYQYFRLDGSTGIEQRQAMMERFNADSKIFCFILSTRSGGVGINLTGADTVIFYDSDWNPTMDAQAQDRCHRIGQTRSVSIYRLISERTIEENILKKAIQKRRLGELAIDEAGFTPDFFKQTDNIRDLFAGEVSVDDISTSIDAPKDQKELDKAMSSLEDEQDVAAAKMASAEAKLDSAEFDEKLPTNNLAGPEDSDDKYIELINQLKPIERYAVNFLEAEYKPDFEEEVKEAEALIEQKKDDWQKAHEKAMHEENNTEDDFYGCGSLLDEVRSRRRRDRATNINTRPRLVPSRQSARKLLAMKKSPLKSARRAILNPSKQLAVRSAVRKVVVRNKARIHSSSHSQSPEKSMIFKRGPGRPRRSETEGAPSGPSHSTVPKTLGHAQIVEAPPSTSSQSVKTIRKTTIVKRPHHPTITKTEYVVSSPTKSSNEAPNVQKSGYDPKAMQGRLVPRLIPSQPSSSPRLMLPVKIIHYGSQRATGRFRLNSTGGFVSNSSSNSVQRPVATRFVVVSPPASGRVLHHEEVRPSLGDYARPRRSFRRDRSEGRGSSIED